MRRIRKPTRKVVNDFKGCAVFAQSEDRSCSGITSYVGGAVEQSITPFQQLSLWFQPVRSAREMMENSEAAAILVQLEDRASIRNPAKGGRTIQRAITPFE